MTRTTWISAANPVTKLAASLVLAAVLLLSVDVVSAGVALAAEVLALPWCGLPAQALARRLGLLATAAVLAGATTAVLAPVTGRLLWSAGPLNASTGSLTAAAAIVLRVLAVAVPGVVLLATTDPTDLADALAQRLRLPHRFVLGALAGLRLVGLLVEDWRTLVLARRARGVGDARGPVGRARVLGGQAFALLVLALRRGTRLAVAMEARGFGSSRERTWARPSTFARRDALLLAAATLAAAGAAAAAVAAGTWSLVLS